LYLDPVSESCVEACLDTYWEDLGETDNPLCSPCAANCLWCDTTAIECTKCHPLGGEVDLYLDPTTDSCVEECPETYFEDGTEPTNPLCSPCEEPCFWCGTTATECTKCHDLSLEDTDPFRYLEASTCVENCLDTFWEDGTDVTHPICSPCHENCLWCNTTAIECTKCHSMDDEDPDLFLDLTTDSCVDECPNTYWENGTTTDDPLCSPCNYNCLWCDKNATDCTLCDAEKFPRVYLHLLAHVCLEDCSLELWEDDNEDGLKPLEAPRVGPICSPCTEECIECFGPSA
jgi:hypothetical protein